jgi:hypothetical protein
MRPIMIAIIGGLLATRAIAQKPAADACAGPERGQFDFWVGAWDVYPTGTDKLVAHSRIEKLYNGCAIRENWMPIGGTGGGSLSAWNPRTGKWHQTWVDSSGATVMFDGGMSGDTMTISGTWPDVIAPGKDGVVRMNYRRNPDGTVRQWGEVTGDSGRNWSPSFDFTYKPAR